MPGRKIVVVVVASAIAFAAWRSIFVGGWHTSGDGSYSCPHSPWRTAWHPLRPGAFGPLFRGIPEACNHDAKRVVVGWAIALLIGAVLTVLLLRRRRQRGRAQSAVESPLS